jgi:DNA mismatch endonuclease (patch repair protein)
MADVFTKRKRSDVMSKIRAKNTKPEIVVRKFLFAHGYRYRIHQKKLAGNPDIVLKKYNAIILVNGCFWHGHKRCKISRAPKTQKNYWIPKIENNIKRDFRNRRKLKKLGWNVITVWECQLVKSKQEKTLQVLLNKILAD